MALPPCARSTVHFPPYDGTWALSVTTPSLTETPM